jgi:CHRD domain
VSKKPTRWTALLGTSLVLFVTGLGVGATASGTTRIPAVAYRLTAPLTPAQEVPAITAPATATGRFDALLVRTGPGTVLPGPGSLPPGCHVFVPPPRSGLPTRIVCDNGRLIVPLPKIGVRWTLAWRLSFSGLSGPATAAHIHLGARGHAGPVIISLCRRCNRPVRGVGPVTASQAAGLLRSDDYVNVHTSKNPAGEIRGQITRVPVGARSK